MNPDLVNHVLKYLREASSSEDHDERVVARRLLVEVEKMLSGEGRRDAA